MKRSQHSGPFLVVEGRDDKLFYRRHLNDACNFTVAPGREAVEEVIAILDDDGFDGVLGLTDTDFDGLEGRAPASSNLVQTDDHDLECMLLKSDALDEVLNEFGSRNKLGNLGMPVRERLLRSMTPVGLLRWTSHREGLGLKFSGVSLRACLDPRTLDLDEDELIRRVLANTGGQTLSADELRAHMADLGSKGADGWHVCSGPDLVVAMSVGLTRVLGNRPQQDVTPDRLKASLRLAFTGENFSRLGVRGQIEGWRDSNPSFDPL